MASGPIGAILLFLVFILNWFIWLGGWLSDVGQLAVTTNNLSGIEAFALMNLNFTVMIIMIMALSGYMYWGANAQ